MIPLAAVRSIMGRLSWQRNLDEVDPAALAADLGGKAAGNVLQALALERANGGDVESLRERIRSLVKE